MNVNLSKKKRKQILVLLCAASAVAIVVMIAALVAPKVGKGSFSPPAFDDSAVSGTPEVPDGLGYNELYQDGMAYRFSICGRLTFDGTDATVFLTNPSTNDAWLKLRVLDSEGNVLGETGLVKPGEYVKTVELSKALPAGTPVILRIMGYEPDTYLSVGSVNLNTTVGGTSR